MKPLIGISCSYDEKENRFFLARAYVDSVLAAGGIPVILPKADNNRSISVYFRSINGILLAGGGDVDPAYFGEEPLPGLGEISPERDKFEIMLLRAALRKKIPVFGICRGLQVMNVTCGGTIIQHIPGEIKRPLKHTQHAPRWYPTHKIFFQKPSLLADIVKTDCIKVNSYHHQAVKDPAPGFKVTALSSDGVIEAIENQNYPFVIGVQWHPECMTENDAFSRKIFKAFVEAARKI